MADVIERCLTLRTKYFQFRCASSWSNMTASCCRNLFGLPDPEELQRDLRQQEDRLQYQSRERWNYDFQSGCPLPGRFVWQRVASDEREPETCGRIPVERLEPADQTSKSETTVLGRGIEHQHSIPSFTGSCVVSDVVTVSPFSPVGASNKKHRSSPPHSHAGRAKQPRHSRRRTVAKSHNSSGAARVTGRCSLVCLSHDFCK